MPTSDNNIQILEMIRLKGELQSLIAASRGDNVTVSYNGSDITLTAFIEILLDQLSVRPTLTDTNSLISQAIQNVIGGAPETLDTLKELADAIADNKDIIDLLSAALENKVDKEDGKSLSTNDFTDLDKIKVEQSVRVVESEWNPESPYPPMTKLVYSAIQDLSKLASPLQNGLMSNTDKEKLDNLPSIIVGDVIPENLKDGDIFIQHIESGE